MVVGIIIAIAIILVVILFAGSQVSAFVNDIFVGVGQNIRDSETKIPTAMQGEVICDMFVIAKWEVQLATQIFSVVPIIFIEEKDVQGVGIDVSFQDCKISNGLLSFVPLLDFLTTSDEVVPLDLFIPIQSAFEEPYEFSWVLVQSDTGKERKLAHYQDITYIVPSLNFDFRHEQKLVFRDIVPDDYILKIIPIKARFADLDDGQPFLFRISDPTL